MTQATNTTQGEILLGGDFYGEDANLPQLVTTGVTPIATAKTVGKIHVDSKGRLTWTGSGDFATDIQPIAPLGTTTQKGIVEIGRNIDVAAGVISIQDASKTNKGVAQIGSGLNVTNGLVSVNISSLPVATDVVAGTVIIGGGLVATNGVLSFPGAADSTTSSKGVVQPGQGFAISGNVISAPNATTTTKGIVSFNGIGMNTIDFAAGTMHIRKAAPGWYGLVYGVSDSSLNISNGVLSFDGSVIPVASASVAGKVQAGSGFIVNSDGTLSLATAGDATAASKGTIQVGNGFVVNAGVLSVADATTTQKGQVQVSTTNGLSITSGALDVSLANAGATSGVVKSGNTNNITISSGSIDIGPKVAKLDTANVFTKAQTPNWNTFPNISGPAAPNLSSTPGMRQYILTGDVTLNVPTTVPPGCVATFLFTQDATGGRKLTIGSSAYKTNQTITLSTAPNATDLLTMICKDANNIYLLFTPGY